MRTKCIVILCALTYLGVGSLRGQTAKAWADSTAYLIGDPITVHVEVIHPTDVKLSPLVGDTLGVFQIIARDSLELRSTTTTTNFTVAAYDSGTAILPPLEFAYAMPGDSVARTIATNPLVFTIRLVEVDTTKEIKDVKPVLAIPFTVAEISLVIGTLVGIGLLVYSFVQYRKRKQARKPEEIYVPPPKQAHTLAFEELAVLKEKRLWQQGLIKPYYSEVTEIVRRYFENRFGFMALENTTDETMAHLVRYSAAQHVVRQTEAMLRLADLVKFAKYQPAIPEHDEMMAAAFEIIDKTKVVERPVEKAAKETVDA